MRLALLLLAALPALAQTVKWEVRSGIPPGMRFDPAQGALVGVPTLAGVYAVEVCCTHVESAYTTCTTHRVTIAPKITIRVKSITPPLPTIGGVSRIEFTADVDMGVPEPAAGATVERR